MRWIFKADYWKQNRPISVAHLFTIPFSPHYARIWEYLTRVWYPIYSKFIMKGPTIVDVPYLSWLSLLPIHSSNMLQYSSYQQRNDLHFTWFSRYKSAYIWEQGRVVDWDNHYSGFDGPQSIISTRICPQRCMYSDRRHFMKLNYHNNHFLFWAKHRQVRFIYY